MVSLVSHLNVWETCLQLMNRLGYRLEMSYPDDEDGDEGLSTWSATKGGFTFMADDPIQLLGLVAVYEDVQPEDDRDYWWRAKTDRSRPGVYDQVTDQAIAVEEARVEELAALRQVDPRAWEAEVRAAFEMVGVGDVVNAASMLRIPRKELRHILGDPRFADLHLHG
ncbi:hypothetical protein [Catenulispora rubra]|uniref:hypothetical protein n=1 Tax=Catenulispora rubra TaxID=280293 RepID=UPI0018921A00|nr:hypothetical protein [Catenulispora rubra]